MKEIKKIAIIGVGLMGASFSLAIKKKIPDCKVWGYARSEKSFGKIKKLNVVDYVEKDLQKVINEADLIVFGLPVYTIIEYFLKVKPYLKEGAVLIDLGSTKKLIQEQADKILPKTVSFIGCHPLCGSDKSGTEFAKDDLYQGEVCIVTAPLRNQTAQFVKKIWEFLGAKVIVMSVNNHDSLVSLLSHLPHLVSFILTSVVGNKAKEFPMQSFKDMTRISNSSPAVWADIFLSNKKNILKDIKHFVKFLDKLTVFLEKSDKEKLVNFIDKTNKIQASL